MNTYSTSRITVLASAFVLLSSAFVTQALFQSMRAQSITVAHHHNSGDGTGINSQDHCGNYILEEDKGEECDDGNDNGRSLSNCTRECRQKDNANSDDDVCGNGIEEGSEECDDGNGDNTDDCTNHCYNAECGDGYHQPSAGEECDDGNRNDHNTDQCTNRCKNAVCGDGFVLRGSEECDRGNRNSETGVCSTSCKFNPVCGNNIVEAGEECDDGNNRNKDACTNACRNAICGDGIKRKNSDEECDKGPRNGIAGSECSSTCTRIEDHDDDDGSHSSLS
ncbi:MAG: DUF4215 domain-containing protein, partial [Candidatus Peribacteraceae bacterium]|nr:DUF4215 domain-containing protein [Candidatus Peribacteraceae bacterium]